VREVGLIFIVSLHKKDISLRKNVLLILQRQKANHVVTTKNANQKLKYLKPDLLEEVGVKSLRFK